MLKSEKLICFSMNSFIMRKLILFFFFTFYDLTLK